MKPSITRSLLLAAALAGSATSNALAGADNFDAATLITGSAYDSGSVSILTYTAQAGEPGLKYGNTGAGRTAWWKWVATEDGFCTVDTLWLPSTAAIYDTLAGVYTGTQVNALTQVGFSDDHWTNIDGASFRGSSCAFYATKGTTYHIAVDGYDASGVTAATHAVRLHLGLLPKRGMRKSGIFRLNTDFHGSLSIQKTSILGFSGKLVVGPKSYPLAGTLTAEGYFTTAIPRTAPAGSPPPLPISLIIDMKDSGSFNVSPGGGTWDSATLQEVIQFPVGTSSTVAGNFAGSFPLANVSANGLVFSTVKPNGAVTGSVVLPDGVKLTFSGGLCKTDTAIDFEVPMCVPLHAGKGYFYNNLTFSETGMEDMMKSTGNVHYVRPSNAKSVFYTAGISASGQLVGGTYVKPALNQRALGFLNGTMGDGSLSIPMVAGEIGAVTEGLNLSTLNKFFFKTPVMRKPLLTLNPLTGQVTGSIYEPAGKRRTITGALYKYNGQLFLKGQVAGTTQNVSFQVMP